MVFKWVCVFFTLQNYNPESGSAMIKSNNHEKNNNTNDHEWS